MRISFFFFIFLFAKVYSQPLTIKNTPLLELLNQKRAVSLSTDISNNYQFFTPDNYRFNNYAQFLIKNNKGMYCLIQATGRVYQFVKYKPDSILIKRIDSTHFYGYNNSAIIFSNNDTIFSFGGNGFWNFNGHLRYFDENQNEWNIIELEKEIHGSRSLFYVDEQNDILYYTSDSYKDPGTGRSVEGNQVIMLNLKTKKVRILGKINQKISSLYVNPNSLQTCTITPIKSLNAVLLCFDLNNKFLINFEENTIRNLTSSKLNALFFGSSNMIRPRTLFEENGILYYTKSGDSTYQIFQEKISINDFQNISDSLYTKNNFYVVNERNFYLIIILFILLIYGLGYFIFINRFKLETKNKELKSELFTPLEIDLIKSVLAKSTKGDKLGCNADEINNILGLKKKTLEIQKKTRTETISRVNQKYKNKFNTDEDLILRHRTDEDRRFYRYIVKEENANKLI